VKITRAILPLSGCVAYTWRPIGRCPEEISFRSGVLAEALPVDVSSTLLFGNIGWTDEAEFRLTESLKLMSPWMAEFSSSLR